MISEIDIKDWESLDIPKAKEAAQKLKDRIWPYTNDYTAVAEELNSFIQAVELLSKRGVKQVPALLKAWSDTNCLTQQSTQ